MTARIIDGKATAKEVRGEVQKWAEFLTAKGTRPGLAVVLVGDDPASAVYVRNKDKAASEACFEVRTIRLDASTSQETVLATVEELNRDESVHGILVQLPLPKGLDPVPVVRAIRPDKDVDGLHPANVAALTMGEDGLVPCTPAGCIELCLRYGIELEGAHAVVVGRSQLVGRPLASLLLARNATVTTCHSRTRDLPALCRQADVLVAAVGRLEMVRGDWIRPGAAVLDVGINRNAEGKLRGDVAYEEALEVAGHLTPVPGGVGPMTIAMLLRNTALAAARRAGLSLKELNGLAPEGAGAS